MRRRQKQNGMSNVCDEPFVVSTSSAMGVPSIRMERPCGGGVNGVIAFRNYDSMSRPQTSATITSTCTDAVDCKRGTVEGTLSLTTYGTESSSIHVKPSKITLSSRELVLDAESIVHRNQPIATVEYVREEIARAIAATPAAFTIPHRDTPVVQMPKSDLSIVPFGTPPGILTWDGTTVGTTKPHPTPSRREDKGQFFNVSENHSSRSIVVGDDKTLIMSMVADDRNTLKLHADRVLILNKKGDVSVSMSDAGLSVGGKGLASEESICKLERMISSLGRDVEWAATIGKSYGSKNAGAHGKGCVLDGHEFRQISLLDLPRDIVSSQTESVRWTGRHEFLGGVNVGVGGGVAVSEKGIIRKDASGVVFDQEAVEMVGTGGGVRVKKDSVKVRGSKGIHLEAPEVVICEAVTFSSVEDASTIASHKSELEMRDRQGKVSMCIGEKDVRVMGGRSLRVEGAGLESFDTSTGNRVVTFANEKGCSVILGREASPGQVVIHQDQSGLSITAGTVEIIKSVHGAGVVFPSQVSFARSVNAPMGICVGKNTVLQEAPGSTLLETTSPSISVTSASTTSLSTSSNPARILVDRNVTVSEAEEFVVSRTGTLPPKITISRVGAAVGTVGELGFEISGRRVAGLVCSSSHGGTSRLVLSRMGAHGSKVKVIDAHDGEDGRRRVEMDGVLNVSGNVEVVGSVHSSSFRTSSVQCDAMYISEVKVDRGGMSSSLPLSLCSEGEISLVCSGSRKVHVGESGVRMDSLKVDKLGVGPGMKISSTAGEFSIQCGGTSIIHARSGDKVCFGPSEDFNLSIDRATRSVSIEGSKLVTAENAARILEGILSRPGGVTMSSGFLSPNSSRLTLGTEGWVKGDASGKSSMMFTGKGWRLQGGDIFLLSDTALDLNASSSVSITSGSSMSFSSPTISFGKGLDVCEGKLRFGCGGHLLDVSGFEGGLVLTEAGAIMREATDSLGVMTAQLSISEKEAFRISLDTGMDILRCAAGRVNVSTDLCIDRDCLLSFSAAGDAGMKISSDSIGTEQGAKISFGEGMELTSVGGGSRVSVTEGNLSLSSSGFVSFSSPKLVLSGILDIEATDVEWALRSRGMAFLSADVAGSSVCISGGVAKVGFDGSVVLSNGRIPLRMSDAGVEMGDSFRIGVSSSGEARVLFGGRKMILRAAEETSLSLCEKEGVIVAGKFGVGDSPPSLGVCSRIKGGLHVSSGGLYVGPVEDEELLDGDRCLINTSRFVLRHSEGVVIRGREEVDGMSSLTISSGKGNAAGDNAVSCIKFQCSEELRGSLSTSRSGMVWHCGDVDSGRGTSISLSETGPCSVKASLVVGGDLVVPGGSGLVGSPSAPKARFEISSSLSSSLHLSSSSSSSIVMGAGDKSGCVRIVKDGSLELLSASSSVSLSEGVVSVSPGLKVSGPVSSGKGSHHPLLDLGTRKLFKWDVSYLSAGESRGLRFSSSPLSESVLAVVIEGWVTEQGRHCGHVKWCLVKGEGWKVDSSTCSGAGGELNVLMEKDGDVILQRKHGGAGALKWDCEMWVEVRCSSEFASVTFEPFSPSHAVDLSMPTFSHTSVTEKACSKDIIVDKGVTIHRSSPGPILTLDSLSTSGGLEFSRHSKVQCSLQPADDGDGGVNVIDASGAIRVGMGRERGMSLFVDDSGMRCDGVASFGRHVSCESLISESSISLGGGSCVLMNDGTGLHVSACGVEMLTVGKSTLRVRGSIEADDVTLLGGLSCRDGGIYAGGPIKGYPSAAGVYAGMKGGAMSAVCVHSGRGGESAILLSNMDRPSHPNSIRTIRGRSGLCVSSRVVEFDGMLTVGNVDRGSIPDCSAIFSKGIGICGPEGRNHWSVQVSRSGDFTFTSHTTSSPSAKMSIASSGGDECGGVTHWGYPSHPELVDVSSVGMLVCFSGAFVQVTSEGVSRRRMLSPGSIPEVCQMSRDTEDCVMGVVKSSERPGDGRSRTLPGSLGLVSVHAPKVLGDSRVEILTHGVCCAWVVCAGGGGVDGSSSQPCPMVLRKGQSLSVSREHPGYLDVCAGGRIVARSMVDVSCEGSSRVADEVIIPRVVRRKESRPVVETITERVDDVEEVWDEGSGTFVERKVTRNVSRQRRRVRMVPVRDGAGLEKGVKEKVVMEEVEIVELRLDPTMRFSPGDDVRVPCYPRRDIGGGLVAYMVPVWVSVS